MRNLIFFIISFSFVSLVHANELEMAYQKEYAYLVAEKRALEQRLSTMKVSQSQSLRKIEGDITGLESAYLDKRNQVDRLNRQILDASREADFSENDSALLETTLLQARESLKRVGLALDETKALDMQLASAYKQADDVIARDSTVYKTEDTFFNADGRAVTAPVINVGRIAHYAADANNAGILAPSGDGMFKIWDTATAGTAMALAENQWPDTLSVFFYDNPNNAVEKQEEKTFASEMLAGGLIAKIILGIGILGALLVALRVSYLLLFSANIQSTTDKVSGVMQQGSIEQALDICKEKMNSVSRVISATLRNLDKDRDHIEDIISESILFESSRIDRFGSMIIVIAAVAPLLGLLGTVTGMISTFDIITEFGTGDPKLLSTGISEALITTKYGLIVAIPLLLLGNMLSSWATRTKNDLERAALHMINTHKSIAA